MKIAALLAALAAAPALAQETRITVGGHEIRLAETPDVVTGLYVDGTLVHQAYQLLLTGEPSMVAGVLVVTGVTGPGGNACNPDVFVLALPEGAAPAFYTVPNETCRYFEPRIEAERIVFATEASAATPGATLVWTPAAGLVSGPTQGFAADPSRGWDDVASLDNAHPIEILEMGEIAEEIYSLVGADRDLFVRLANGTGSGRQAPPGYVSGACEISVCDEVWAVIILDTGARRPYVAWKTYDGAITTRPADPWPPATTAALEAWINR